MPLQMATGWRSGALEVLRLNTYDGYTGKNPKTGKPIKVKAKKLPFFKCGKDLKEKVDTYK